MEQRITLVVFLPKPYREMIKYFDSSSGEALCVGFGKAVPDPSKPTWKRLEISEVLIPDDADYVCRTHSFIHMKRQFTEKIKRFTEEHQLRPLVFDHKQPIDVPSGTDAVTSRKVAEYYSDAVMGSYNFPTHRFFRFAGEKGMEMVSWMVDDETFDRQELVFGKEPQYAIASTKVLLVGAGGVGWKTATDLVLKGFCWIDIVDPDTIEQSNLARLPVHPSSVGKMKAEELANMLREIRPNGNFQAWTGTIETVPEAQFAQYDLMIVATDNVPSRLNCNDISILRRIPSIQIGASLENNQAAVSRRVVIPGVTPCFECHKEFTPEQLRFNYLTREQKERLKTNSNYGSPRPVPSVVDLNSIAAGLVADAAFRILAKTEAAPAYVILNLTTTKFESYFEGRDPNCRACSQIPDFDADWLVSNREDVTQSASAVITRSRTNESNRRGEGVHS
jgi:molybdopterin/thiamine biosynthesis adenylyltransferase